MCENSPLFPLLKINCPAEEREKVTRRRENEKMKEGVHERDGVRRALQRRERNLHQSWDVLGTNVACIKETKIYCRLGAFWLNFCRSLLVVSVNLFHFGASIRKKTKLWPSYSIFYAHSQSLSPLASINVIPFPKSWYIYYIGYINVIPFQKAGIYCISWYLRYHISKQLVGTVFPGTNVIYKAGIYGISWY